MKSSTEMGRLSVEGLRKDKLERTEDNGDYTERDYQGREGGRDTGRGRGEREREK